MFKGKGKLKPAAKKSPGLFDRPARKVSVKLKTPKPPPRPGKVSVRGYYRSKP